MQRIQAAIVAWQLRWEDARAAEYLAAALRRVTKDCPTGAEIQFVRTFGLADQEDAVETERECRATAGEVSDREVVH